MIQKAEQLEAKKMGASGCYFFSIIAGCILFAKEHFNQSLIIDKFELYEKALAKGWIDEDCTCFRPDLIANYILNVPVTVRHAELSAVPKENEIEITRYELKQTGTTFAHFVLTRNGEVLHDPYGNSNTVAKGTKVSKRILAVKI